jgi:hypothetical protein
MRLTCTAPQFHDYGTHFVTQHKLDYDLLKQIQDHPEVKEVAGTHMVILVSISASHEPSTHASRRKS